MRSSESGPHMGYKQEWYGPHLGLVHKNPLIVDHHEYSHGSNHRWKQLWLLYDHMEENISVILTTSMSRFLCSFTLVYPNSYQWPTDVHKVVTKIGKETETIIGLL